MRIKKLIIENFKGIFENVTVFDSEKVALLAGPNGIGKTSFMEAMRFALTGVVPQNPIKDKADFSTVSVELSDGTTFSRTIYRDGRPSRVVVDGRVTPAKNLNSLIQTNYGFGTDVLKIATASEVLTAMKSDELGDFLLRYIPEKLNATKVLGYISDVTESVQEAVLLELPDGDFDIADVTTAYESFVEIRKSAKKEVEFIKNKLSRIPSAKPARELADVQRAYDAVLEKEGAFKGIKDAIKLYNDVKTKRDMAIKNVEALQKRFDAFTATRPVPAVREELEAKLSLAQKKASDARNMINIMNNTIATLSVTLERLATNHCPLSDALICTTDKSAVRNEILETVKSNKDGISIQNKIVEEALAEINAITLSVKEYDANAASYKEKIFIGEQMEKAKKNFPSLPPRPPFIEDVDCEKEKEILKAEMEYAKKWEERKGLEKKQKEEEERVELYDFLCKEFAPKGEVMTKILASYLSLFEDVINERSAALRTDMCVKFVPENGTKYYVKVRGDKEFHLYDELSCGEKILAAFLLLDLVSALCGTRILLLDELNSLDSRSLGELFDLVTSSKMLEEYDNIVLASVNTDELDRVVRKHESVIQKI